MQAQHAQSIDQPQSLGFFDIIDFPGEPFNCLHLFSVIADAYLCFGGNVANVTSHKGRTYDIELERHEGFPLWVTIAKVISYATIILPLIALIVKAIVRCSYNFNVVGQNDSKKGEPRSESHSTEETRSLVHETLSSLHESARATVREVQQLIDPEDTSSDLFNSLVNEPL